MFLNFQKERHVAPDNQSILFQCFNIIDSIDTVLIPNLSMFKLLLLNCVNRINPV